MDQEQGQRLHSDWTREWEREFRDAPPPPRRPGGPDLAPLFALIEALRRPLPRELQDGSRHAGLLEGGEHNPRSSASRILPILVGVK